MSLRDSLARDIKKALQGACELALDIPLGLLHQYLRHARLLKRSMACSQLKACLHNSFGLQAGTRFLRLRLKKNNKSTPLHDQHLPSFRRCLNSKYLKSNLLETFIYISNVSLCLNRWLAVCFGIGL